MQVNNIPIDELKPFERNPKKHPRSQIDSLKKSFREFGWTNPVLIAADNMIVAGHGRIIAAKECGFTEVPVIKLDMSYEKAVAYVLADNHLAEIAETDNNLLAELLEEVSQIPDFDIEATGYSTSDIDDLLKEIEEHDKRFRPGEGGITGKIDFIKDEEVAIAADVEAKERFAGKNTILVIYSGGKDSTFALLWAKSNFPDKKIVAIFSDTGVEFPGMTAHIRDVCLHVGVEYKIVKPEVDVWEYWAEKGRFFSLIFPECQSMLVYDPINAYIRTYDSNNVIVIDGSRGDQVRRLSKKTKTSGSMDPKMKNYTYYHPCHDIAYEVEESIVKKSGVPLWEGYAMGFKRSACWCCPAQASEQAYALSVNYPGLVEVMRRWEKRLGEPLQMTSNRNIDQLIETGRKKHQKRLQGENVEDDWVKVDNTNEESLSDDTLVS